MKHDNGGFRGTGRFRVLQRLGAGGVGVVYSAHDVGRDEVIALKALRHADPATIYQLKKEFRALADLAHPNLVTLYELISDGDRWFFTMELVDGVSLLDFVRPGALDIGRLRTTLPQVACGIMAIHQAGLLHRDLKPSNVLVTPDGRVVIVDFGISAAFTATVSAVHTTEDGIRGTAPYMAPEQVHGKACPASDWYAFGVMLYEALTGVLPFSGTPLAILTAKQTQDPPCPQGLAPDVPMELADLTVALLARDPSRRPVAAQVLQRLGVPRDARFPTMPTGRPDDAQVVGRERHLSDLHRAFELTRAHDAVSVYVHGPSGIGKTTLVQRFLQLLAPDAPLVLAGRCYDRESVPFKALDGVIDKLSGYLRSLSPQEIEPLLEPELLTLARLFPVLERVERIAELSPLARDTGDPVELQRRAFAALRNLLRRIADRRRLVVLVDDLHWADADSIALFEALMSAPDPPPLLLLATFRTEEIESHPFLQMLLAQARTRVCQEIRLGPLSEAETRRLARHLLGVADSN
ncbi:MAG TPA: serine/threonine-protein kinase, partial [Gemmatimonadales bacterium]|nr:serine/threonine-protein kinase [Gemmatimonadales bacterium]